MARTNLELLERYVSDGLVEIVQIVSPPRTMSTPLGRALNEVEEPSVFVNEPLNRYDNTVPAAANYILDNARTALEAGAGRVRVVTKNMAAYVTTEAFRAMVGLSSATIFTVRNPLIQIGSQVERFANPGMTDLIAQDMLTPELWQRVSDHLEKSEHSKNFSLTGWVSFGSHFKSEPQPERSAVVDGDDFSAEPERVLREICKRTGLPFSMHMVYGWRRGYFDTTTHIGADGRSVTESAWTRRAATSVGVVAVHRAMPDIEQMPRALRRHIIEVALPIYHEIVTSPQFVSK